MDNFTLPDVTIDIESRVDAIFQTFVDGHKELAANIYDSFNLGEMFALYKITAVSNQSAGWSLYVEGVVEPIQAWQSKLYGEYGSHGMSDDLPESLVHWFDETLMDIFNYEMPGDRFMDLGDYIVAHHNEVTQETTDV